MKCIYCKNETPDDSLYCIECGKQISNIKDSDNNSKKVPKLLTNKFSYKPIFIIVFTIIIVCVLYISLNHNKKIIDPNDNNIVNSQNDITNKNEIENEKDNSIYDYYPLTPGLEFTYQYKTDSNLMKNGTRWCTFQESLNDKYYCYSFTGPEGDNQSSFIYGTIGESYFPEGGKGGNISNDANYFYNFIYLPKEYHKEQKYISNGIVYQIFTNESFNKYSDCIKVVFDSIQYQSNDDYLKGKGYFYLAKDIGLVHLHFQHFTSGEFWTKDGVEMFELVKTPSLVEKNSITGKVVDTFSKEPISDVIISSTYMLNFHENYVLTDENGNFDLKLYYGENSTLSIIVGYDTNGDKTIDFEGIQPLEKVLYNVKGHFDVGEINYIDNKE